MQTLTINNSVSQTDLQKLIAFGKSIGISISINSSLQHTLQENKATKQAKAYKAMLKQGLDELEQYRQGKTKTTSLDDFLNEMRNEQGSED